MEGLIHIQAPHSIILRFTAGARIPCVTGDCMYKGKKVFTRLNLKYGVTPP